jgi:hypothetical protein
VFRASFGSQAFSLAVAGSSSTGKMDIEKENAVESEIYCFIFVTIMDQTCHNNLLIE